MTNSTNTICKDTCAAAAFNHLRAQQVLNQQQGDEMRFRKKPVIVEAIRFTVESRLEIREWAGDKVQYLSGEKVMMIETTEGDMKAVQGDWIIKGTHGEFYPCKPDVFETVYEPE